MQKVRLREWQIDSSRYWGLLAVFGAMAVVGGLAALYMEHEGHWVTGMHNQIVWGMPHVFAVFLIVAASGALNIASIGTVFDLRLYKPLGPLSGLIAVCLLVGGLLVLVLDLGQPTRLVVAMTTYNFKSIFAWNIFLYTGFIAIVVVYLYTLMERSAKGYGKGLGILAFVWRLVLTTGTGAIFGFLVARPGYDAAIMAPMFIIMSLAYGLAVTLLVLLYAYRGNHRPLGDTLERRLKNLLGVFVAAVLYFTLVFHLTNLYGTENHGFEQFILQDGGVYTWLFWGGSIFLGGIVPLGILYHPALGRTVGGIVAASLLVIGGGLATLYVIIIGGQAYPMPLFPGKTVIDSGFGSAIASYTPSVPEVLLGLGGVAVSLLAVFVGMRVLKFLPESLADEVIDPHRNA